MSVPRGWDQWIGRDGLIIGLNRFGTSAPGEELIGKMGFSPQEIMNKVLLYLRGQAE